MLPTPDFQCEPFPAGSTQEKSLPQLNDPHRYKSSPPPKGFELGGGIHVKGEWCIK